MKQLVDLIKSDRYIYIDIFYAKTCATTKISTVAGYHACNAFISRYKVQIYTIVVGQLKRKILKHYFALRN